jgi:hypothetical protein
MIDKTREFLKQLEAANAEARLREFRKLARRTGLVEAYVATWHGRGVLQEKLCICVDRCRDGCEITAQTLEQDEHGDWQPARTQGRPLTLAEWEQVGAWLEAGFWQLSSRDAAGAVMDGDCWRMEGYRDDTYHNVYRHTGSLIDGSGAEVYELGRRLARLAGLRRFEQDG